MLAERVIADLGGVAARAEILERVTEASLRRALASGSVVRVSRGRYALPSSPLNGGRDVLSPEVARAGRRAAHEVSGTAILLSAAARWGWSAKSVARVPQVAVPRGRKVPASTQHTYDVRWRDTPVGDCEDGWVTNRVRTATDCACLLPGDEALAILDSALREGAVDQDELLLAAAALPALHRGKVEGLIRLASPLAANPFESVLRWIVSDIPGLSVRAQVRITDDGGFIGVVDLADEELRIALEADSFEFHGDRATLDRDCIRYDRLVADGWLVLRFSWEQVMWRPEMIRDLVVRTVAQRDPRV